MKYFFLFKCRRFFYLVKHLFFGSSEYKNIIRVYDPSDIDSLEVGATIQWVDRGTCTFGLDEIKK